VERAAGSEGECSGGGGGGGQHFALKDLWEFFEEWSAYGVEVPLCMGAERHEVFQYYVPFLSGMQLFRTTAGEGRGEGEGKGKGKSKGKGEGGRGGGGEGGGGWVAADNGGSGGGGGEEGEEQPVAATSPAATTTSTNVAGIASTVSGAATAAPAAAKGAQSSGGRKGVLGSGAAATKTGEEVLGRQLVFQFMVWMGIGTIPDTRIRHAVPKSYTLNSEP